VAVIVFALMLTAVGGFIFSADAWGALHYSPLLALVCVGIWMLYWRPVVVVESTHFTIVNVARTWVIPFTCLEAVETKYALAVVTNAGKVTAWAAPAPGRHQTLSLSLADFRAVRRGKQVDNVRPGDAPNTESGSVAFVVRRRWQDAVEAQKSKPGEKPELVTTKWHTASLVTVGVLLVLAIAGIATA
jgi:hypothetical protein